MINDCLSEVLTTTEAGELWELPGDTIKRAALQGRLKARKSGWVWLTTRAAMKEYFGDTNEIAKTAGLRSRKRQKST